MGDGAVAPKVIDRAIRDRAAASLRRAGVRLPRFAELATPRGVARGGRSRPARSGQSVSRPLVQRPHPPRSRGGAGASRLAAGADRRRIADRRRARLPVPDDRRAQIARRLWRAWCRASSPGVSIPSGQGGVAVDRQLLPRRRRDLAHPRLPRRRRPPGGHERGALRLAGGLGRPPDDIVRTPGTESNVKEIYDRCAELARDPGNIVLNQFAEFGNYLAHYACTGPALRRVFEACERRARARLAGFVAASGSAGTLGGGRLSEGEVRRPHRRGRGQRVPDPVAQRLWRAQHPGHRRQARAAHPQRHEHRSRRRRLGPQHRRARPVVQQRRPAPPISPAAAASTRRLVEDLRLSASRASPISLAAIKTAKFLDLGAGRRARHGRHRQRRDVRQRARRTSGARTTPTASMRSTPARSSASICAGIGTDDVLEIDACRAHPDLQSRLLHLGRAAGRAVGRFRRAPRPGLLARAAAEHCRNGMR